MTKLKSHHEHWTKNAMRVGGKIIVAGAKKGTQNYIANMIAPKANKSNIVTSQQDVSVTRKRKRNIKSLQKQKRFKAKIYKALAPDQELNVYCENSLKGVIPNIVGAQVGQQYVSTDLPMLLNTGVLWSSDTNTGWILGRYRNITGSNNVLAAQGSKGLINFNAFKMNFGLTKMEISITNRLAVPLVYDVYECVAARDLGTADANYNYPTRCWIQCLLDAYVPTDVTTNNPVRPVVQTAGQTPYDVPSFGRYWKILKKTRVLLPPGNTSEQMIMGNKFTMSGDRFNNNFAIKGLTKGVIIVGGVGDNSAAPASATPETTSVVTNKTWHFKYQLGEGELPQRPTAICKINLAL